MKKSNLQLMYISLPMTGIENENKELEDKAAVKAESMGYITVVPSELTKYVRQEVNDPMYKHYLGYDLWCLGRCDAMLLCPGWEKSKGCKIEVRFAIENNIPIYDYRISQEYDISSLYETLNKNSSYNLLD